MQSLPIAVFALTLAGACCANALDLTPNESWRLLEGTRLTTLMFKDAKGNVRYQPPGNWAINGGPNLLSLYPGKQGAYMQFRVASRGNAAKVTGEASDELAKWTRTYLPPDAAEAKIVEERPSPFTLGGLPSREYIYSYKAAGQRFSTAVAVCDLSERERFVVVITALHDDFAEIHEAGISSLFSWNWRD